LDCGSTELAEVRLWIDLKSEIKKPEMVEGADTGSGGLFDPTGVNALRTDHNPAHPAFDARPHFL
jgi:hypothetical protein